MRSIFWKNGLSLSAAMLVFSCGLFDSKTGLTGKSRKTSTVPQQSSVSSTETATSPAVSTASSTSSITASTLPEEQVTFPYPESLVDSLWDTGLPVSQNRVGINFDDGGAGQSDQDFNDAVLCFQGQFLVDTKSGMVVSIKDQRIEASLSRNAYCNNALRVTVLHADGSKVGPSVYRTSQGEIVKLNLAFKTKSVLNVEILAGAGCNFFGSPRSTADREAAVVAIDKCFNDNATSKMTE